MDSMITDQVFSPPESYNCITHGGVISLLACRESECEILHHQKYLLNLWKFTSVLELFCRRSVFLQKVMKLSSDPVMPVTPLWDYQVIQSRVTTVEHVDDVILCSRQVLVSALQGSSAVWTWDHSKVMVFHTVLNFSLMSFIKILR